MGGRRKCNRIARKVINATQEYGPISDMNGFERNVVVADLMKRSFFLIYNSVAVWAASAGHSPLINPDCIY